MIAAMAKERVIGKDNDVPWRLPADLKYFMKTTTGHHIIMGRKNFQSLPKRLPNRTNIVLSRQEKFQAFGCVVVQNLEEALELARFNGEEEAFIIGGAQIYELAFPLAHRLYLTYIDLEVEGDTFFPEYDQSEWELKSERAFKADEKNKYDHRYCVYERT